MFSLLHDLLSHVSSGHWTVSQHSRQTPVPSITQQCCAPAHPSPLLPSQQMVRAMHSPPQHRWSAAQFVSLPQPQMPLGKQAVTPAWQQTGFPPVSTQQTRGAGQSGPGVPTTGVYTHWLA